MHQYHLTIKELPHTEQPRELLRSHGASALSDAELLAILLRVGLAGQNVVQLAQSVLRDFGGLAGLQRADYAELCATRGLGEAKAATIKATLEIGRRLLLESGEDRLQIRSPIDVVALMRIDMSHLDQEHLRVVALDTKNQVLRIVTVYIGSLNSATVRVGELFKEALKLNAAAMILVHNHPSGDPTPSPDDVAVTRDVIKAGRLLDIDCLDHLIIGHGRWASMRERGLAWPQEETK